MLAHSIVEILDSVAQQWCDSQSRPNLSNWAGHMEYFRAAEEVGGELFVYRRCRLERYKPCIQRAVEDQSAPVADIRPDV